MACRGLVHQLESELILRLPRVLGATDGVLAERLTSLPWDEVISACVRWHMHTHTLRCAGPGVGMPARSLSPLILLSLTPPRFKVIISSLVSFKDLAAFPRLLWRLAQLRCGPEL